ncbi:hypothetical protein EYC84_010890 [Monilinia fructicola]|uniref:Uncharacterized protein n=1 Tax=Monilinia fructicola TaxID=38448 RepID=A0A5M9J6L7_MONFR|nr:hypothetical protein EYC84_010890 [Monilinia fructicola]
MACITVLVLTFQGYDDTPQKSASHSGYVSTLAPFILTTSKNKFEFQTSTGTQLRHIPILRDNTIRFVLRSFITTSPTWGKKQLPHTSFVLEPTILITIMHLSSTQILSFLAFLPSFTYAQAGLGGVVATSAATQMATTTLGAPSLYTADGTTTVKYIATYTQTFATTALGTWAIGATPLVGSIGLGTIHGQVGTVRNKRALPSGVFGGSH